jgi:hypothetical protein
MRRATNVPKSRLNLEMSEAVRKQLEQLRTKTQADSLAEVIRRALVVYDYLWEAKENGGVILVKDAESTRELVLV